MRKVKTMIKNFLHSRISSYGLGMIIGVILTLSLLFLFGNNKFFQVQEQIHKELTSIKKTNEFIENNRDYIIAGLALDPSNVEYYKHHQEKVLNFLDMDQKEFKEYMEMNIKPIYLDALKNQLEKYSFDTSQFLVKIKSRIIEIIKEKIDNIKNTKSKNIIDQSEYYQNIIQTKIKEKIDDIKNTQLKKIIDQSEHYQKIIQKKIKEKIDDIKINISEEKDYLLRDVDNDYTFGVITIGNKQIDLTFLNYLDLYIDPDTITYNDKGTNNPLDDVLIIRDIYITFEVLDGPGIDLIDGEVKITGGIAGLIMQNIGSINEQI